MTSNAAKTARDIAIPALCAAIMIAVQVTIAFLPNVELVSLLVIVYTLTFRRQVLYIIYTFALVEGMIFGFYDWWYCYLYVWTILAGATWLLRSMKSPLGWAVLSGAFGLMFGALCSITYLFIGGPAYMLSWWISGIPYDLIHCAANFALCLALMRPLRSLLQKTQTYRG